MSARRKAGQGCWASHKTLAALCGVNYNNLSTAISELGQWGYLTRQSHPLNKRQHVYRVTYETSPNRELSQELDAPNNSPTDEQISLNSSPSCELSRARTSDVSIESISTLRQEENETQQDQAVDGVEYIPWKREEILQKQKRNLAEAASLRDSARSKPRANGELFDKADAKPKRKSRIPDEFPDMAAMLWATKHWHDVGRDDLATEKTARHEAEKFRDYNLKENRGAADWPAAWRNWVRNAVEFNRPRRPERVSPMDEPRKILRITEAKQ